MVFLGSQRPGYLSICAVVLTAGILPDLQMRTLRLKAIDVWDPTAYTGESWEFGGFAFVSRHSEIRLGDFLKGGLDSKGAK